MKTNIIVGAAALLAVAMIAGPALAASGTFTAYGTVVDERDRPVAGATVQLISDQVNGASWAVLGTTTSDARGLFRFADVPLGNAGAVKVKATYVENGTTYSSQLVDMQWYDPSSGMVSFIPGDTRLYHYPESDHGFVWGTVLENATGGRMIDATVYLSNGTTTLAADSAESNRYTYQIEAAPGDYEIYAVHVMGASYLVSPRARITILPTYSVSEAAPMTLVADQVVPAASFVTPAPAISSAVTATPAPTPMSPLAPTPSPSTTATPAPAPDIKTWPLAAALALGIIMIAAGWGLMRR